jgi:hypothetical protein
MTDVWKKRAALALSILPIAVLGGSVASKVSLSHAVEAGTQTSDVELAINRDAIDSERVKAVQRMLLEYGGSGAEEAAKDLRSVRVGGEDVAGRGTAGEAFSTLRVNSYVWGGYYADVTTYGPITGVTTEFVAQQCASGCPPKVAPWAGVGGVYGNAHIVQAGVDLLNMKMWYEAYGYDYPNYDNNTADLVNQGDTIYVSIFLVQSSGSWYTLVEDLNTGKAWSHSYPQSLILANQQSADWIVEGLKNYDPPNYQGYPVFQYSQWRDSTSQGSVWQNIDSSQDAILYQTWNTPNGCPNHYALEPSTITGGQSFTIHQKSSC